MEEFIFLLLQAVFFIIYFLYLISYLLLLT